MALARLGFLSHLQLLEVSRCQKRSLILVTQTISFSLSGDIGGDLGYQRAGDGPAYLTILIVGHILGFALHVAFPTFRAKPLTHWMILISIAIVASLVLLSRFKGMIFAHEWTRRMHGF